MHIANLAARSFVAVAIALAGLPASAHAQSNAEKTASSEFDAGTAALAKQQWKSAAKHFSASYAAVPQAATAFNLAKAYAKTQQFRLAALYYQRYLATADSPADGDKVRKFVAEFHSKQCTGSIQSVRGAEIKIDSQKSPRQATATYRTTIGPGIHKIEVWLTDKKWTGPSEILCEYGEPIEVRYAAPTTSTSSAYTANASVSAGTMLHQICTKSRDDTNPGLDIEVCGRSCKLGEIIDCQALIAAYDKDIKAPGSRAELMKWRDAACKLNDDSACIAFANQALAGDGIVRNSEIAAGALTTACRRGSAKACQIGGFLFDDDKYKVRDIARATRFFEDGCKLDDQLSCTNFAVQLDDGKYVDKDSMRAQALHIRACEHKIPAACHNAGIALRTTNGPQALLMFTFSCNNRIYESCQQLGAMYALGLGTTKDEAVARRYMATACDGGIKDACVAP